MADADDARLLGQLALFAALALDFDSPEAPHAWAFEGGSSLAVDDLCGLNP